MPHYYSYDALGSAERLTDADQVEETGYAYYAFGKILDELGTPVTNPFRYVGQLGYYFDTDLAEMHVRARDYRAAIVRWLTSDMLFRAAHYRYVRNRPVVLLDPSGFAPPWPGAGGIGPGFGGLFDP